MYLSLYLKGFVCERVLETEQNCNILTPTLMAISVVSFSFSSAAPGGLGASLSGCWLPLPHLISSSYDLQLTHFLSSPSYIIVQSPTQYLPITGHRDVSLPLSLEWHVWLSSSGNNCHAVHRSFSPGASVYDCTEAFYLVPFCLPRSTTPMEYALPPSLACLAGSKVSVQHRWIVQNTER